MNPEAGGGAVREGSLRLHREIQAYARMIMNHPFLCLAGVNQ